MTYFCFFVLIFFHILHKNDKIRKKMCLFETMVGEHSVLFAQNRLFLFDIATISKKRIL